ncbi:MAG: outer membrane lipoprotein carrier protein LolA [Deltaproteobacteria bacterium]|nr:MAG: outer membrane lipoprotein carrier protein LolA [Deltaproteobacteria bacterium]
MYRPRDKEVEHYNDIHDQVSREALVFLGGLGTMTREFRVSEKNETLTLIPKNKSSLMKQIVLTIDPRTSLVREVTLFPKSGNHSLYEFSNTKTNQSYDDKIFHAP